MEEAEKLKKAEAEPRKQLETPKEELTLIPGQETPAFGMDGALEIDLHARFRMDDALKSIKEWARNHLKTAGKRGAPKVTFRCEEKPKGGKRMDRYTKFTLTAIAVLLAMNLCKSFPFVGKRLPT